MSPKKPPATKSSPPRPTRFTTTTDQQAINEDLSVKTIKDGNSPRIPHQDSPRKRTRRGEQTSPPSKTRSPLKRNAVSSPQPEAKEGEVKDRGRMTRRGTHNGSVKKKRSSARRAQRPRSTTGEDDISEEIKLPLVVMEDKNDQDYTEDEEYDDDEEEEEEEGAQEDVVEGQEQETPSSPALPPSPNKGPSKKPNLNDDDLVVYSALNRTSAALDFEDLEDTIDPLGETKIDAMGNLLGNREYRVPIFTLPRHPFKVYMLVIDLCKLLEFRDSYFFHLKNKNIPRIYASDEDRIHLIAEGLIPSASKSRPVGLATARSVFRQFGYRLVKRGKPWRDDYWVGETSEPDYYDPTDEEAEKLLEEKLRTSSWNNAPGLNKSQSSVSLDTSSSAMSFDYWLAQAALSASSFNSSLKLQRPKTFNDYHTKVNQKPILLHPARINIELSVEANAESPNSELGTRYFNLPNENSAPHNSLNTEWIHAKPLSNPSKYPVSLVEGQYQGMSSVFAKRYSEEYGLAPPEKLFRQIEQSIVHSNNLVATPSNPSRSSRASRAVIGPPESYTCGEITRTTNTICQKLVAFKGGKCMFHNAAAMKKAAEAAAAKPARRNSRAKAKSRARDEDDEEEEDEEEEEDAYDENTDEELMSPPVSPAPTDMCAHCHQAASPGSQATAETAIVLKCSSCQFKYHPECMDFESNVLVSKVQTYAWHCSNCKICTACSSHGDDEKLLFCDSCDRGYHTFCLEPPLENLPTGAWECERCVYCTSCSKKSESALHHVISDKSEKNTDADKNALEHYIGSFCDTCYKGFQGDSFCPLCFGVYGEEEDLEMICCDSCDRWVHVSCDPSMTEELYRAISANPDAHSYQCVLCDKAGLQLENFIDRVHRSAWGREFTFQRIKYRGRDIVVPALVSPPSASSTSSSAPSVA